MTHNNAVHCPGKQGLRTSQHGFSMIELMGVLIVLFIVAAFAVPNFLTMRHDISLRGAASDFVNLVQATRIRAVQDDAVYSLNIVGSEAFVDLYSTGAWQGTGAHGADPAIVMNAEVTLIAVANAPNSANLKTAFLPTGSTPNLYDGSPGTGTPITFGPRGLPCTSQTTTGGTVCDSAGGPTAYWVFFKDTITGAYQAVTVSPAGRIRRWYYGTGGWNAI